MIMIMMVRHLIVDIFILILAHKNHDDHHQHHHRHHQHHDQLDDYMASCWGGGGPGGDPQTHMMVTIVVVSVVVLILITLEDIATLVLLNSMCNFFFSLFCCLWVGILGNQ